MRRHTLSVLATAATLGALVMATQPAVATAASAPAAVTGAAAAIPATGAYTPLAPARLLDTRRAEGVGTTTPIGAGRSIDLTVLNRGGVPASGSVSAVVLNLTAVAPTSRGYLTVHPSTKARPTASSINFNAGLDRGQPHHRSGRREWQGPDLQRLGPDPRRRRRRRVLPVVHEHGDRADHGSRLVQSTDPTRLVDTRLADWDHIPLGPQEYLWASVDFVDDAFNARVQAVALNVTVVSPTRQGHITVFNGDSPSSIPSTSTLNFTAGRTVPNMAITRVGHCDPPECRTTDVPRFGVANASLGAVHVVVDIVGVYFSAQEGDSGWRFKSLSSPQRFVDSRLGQGLPSNLGPNAERIVAVPSSISGEATRAVVTNTTAAQPTTTTVLTLWPGGARPTVSNLNPYAGQVVSNMTITGLDSSGAFLIHNRVGTTPLVIDAPAPSRTSRPDPLPPCVATPVWAVSDRRAPRRPPPWVGSRAGEPPPDGAPLGGARRPGEPRVSGRSDREVGPAVGRC